MISTQVNNLQDKHRNILYVYRNRLVYFRKHGCLRTFKLSFMTKHLNSTINSVRHKLHHWNYLEIKFCNFFLLYLPSEQIVSKWTAENNLKAQRSPYFGKHKLYSLNLYIYIKHEGTKDQNGQFWGSLIYIQFSFLYFARAYKWPYLCCIEKMNVTQK